MSTHYWRRRLVSRRKRRLESVGHKLNLAKLRFDLLFLHRLISPLLRPKGPKRENSKIFKLLSCISNPISIVLNHLTAPMRRNPLNCHLPSEYIEKWM
jgi:hypothetical protein